MLDIKFVARDPELVQKNCDLRRVKVNISDLVDLHHQKNHTIHELEGLRHKQNEIAQQIPSTEKTPQLETLY